MEVANVYVILKNTRIGQSSGTTGQSALIVGQSLRTIGQSNRKSE